MPETTPTEQAADIADSVTAHTKALLTRRTETLRKRAERAEAERDCLAMAVMFAREWKPDAPMSLRDGIDEILATMPSRMADEPQRPETGLPAEQPCTDPRHTGAIRERLGCSGPDPATT
ncbi:hypothetical protein ABZS83_32950 [Streptomyces sp. NPDC005426]|uniref:hypothetical protein n=1 Tax=Streptomyces sp. NPDC005426 TaxID=3155344 RepID=UPI0033BB69A5